MRNVKLAVVLLFVCVCAFGLSGRLLTPTVHGRTGLAAPTGVTASDGTYNNKVGVHWDAVRDATVYRILRNASNDAASAVSVGTTALPYFFDETAVAGQQYFYWVRAENATGESLTGQPDTGVRAIGTQQGPVPPLEVPPPAPAGERLSEHSTLGNRNGSLDPRVERSLASRKFQKCGPPYGGLLFAYTAEKASNGKLRSQGEVAASNSFTIARRPI